MLELQATSVLYKLNKVMNTSFREILYPNRERYRRQQIKQNTEKERYTTGSKVVGRWLLIHLNGGWSGEDNKKQSQLLNCCSVETATAATNVH